MDNQEEKLVFEAGVLVSRLERLSADSHWARRASGLRGSLLRLLKKIYGDPKPEYLQGLQRLLPEGREILNQAAKEIPDIEALLREDGEH